MRICSVHIVMAVSVGLLLGLAADVRAEATVTVVPSFPDGDVTSVFDVGHGGNSYGLGSGTTFNPAGYDVRDLFGGMFDSFANERGRVVFADNQAKGTVETITVTLASPVSLSNYALWISEDMGSGGARSTREFKLFAGATLLDDVVLLDTSGAQSFTSVFGGNGLKISDTLIGAPTTASYSLQFIQNQNSGVASGLRAEEFEAFTPEPSTLSVIGIGMCGILVRRRR